MHAGAEGCMNRTQGARGMGPGARVGSKTTTFAPSSLDTCLLARSAFWPKPQAQSPALWAQCAASQLSPTPTSTLSRSEEHTSELQSRENLVCRLLLEKENEHKLLRKIA